MRSVQEELRPMRIGLIAPAWVPVPPPVYGGTEVVVDQLARGLTQAGDEVRLFTTGDSTCPVERRWVHPRALGTTADVVAELGQVEAAYEQLADLDLIHDHTLLGPLWAMAQSGMPPVVTTIHGELTPEMLRLYRTVSGRTAVVAVSHDQRSRAFGVEVAAVIHHGIDVDRVPFGTGDGGYVVFLGRMSPDKGAHRAIRAARAAGKRLLIAAKMWEPAERQYFDECVAPLLGDGAVYLGEVGGRAKFELLGAAEALVNPIRWPEPFGLVMVEALAAGTPVCSFPEGAAAEIIDHGRTGFLCADEHDLARRLRQVGSLDRAACRHAARTRFSTRRMVAAHRTLYHRVAHGGERVHSPPLAI